MAWEFHKNTVRTVYNVVGIEEQKEPLFKEYFENKPIPLPPVKSNDRHFSDLIQERCSCRKFKKQPISLASLAAVLNAGYGLQKERNTNDFFERTVPSGGALYSLELYLIALNVEHLDKGIYHFAPHFNRLNLLKKISLNEDFISNLFMVQPYITSASAIVVICSVFERSLQKYGDRGYRYILFEAGHCMQNMNLASLDQGLGTLNMGGFFDDELSALLEVNPETEAPLYCMAMGVPSASTKAAQRTL